MTEEPSQVKRGQFPAQRGTFKHEMNEINRLSEPIQI
jgi:hypothetical protein